MPFLMGPTSESVNIPTVIVCQIVVNVNDSHLVPLGTYDSGGGERPLQVAPVFLGIGPQGAIGAEHSHPPPTLREAEARGGKGEEDDQKYP